VTSLALMPIVAAISRANTDPRAAEDAVTPVERAMRESLIRPPLTDDAAMPVMVPDCTTRTSWVTEPDDPDAPAIVAPINLAVDRAVDAEADDAAR